MPLKFCLDPYSIGMTLEQQKPNRIYEKINCLDPYSIGMTLELLTNNLKLWKRIVLILTLLE